MPLSPKAAAFRSLPDVNYCYIADEGADCSAPAGPRYTQAALCQALQALGCKPRAASKASARVFLILQQRAALPPGEALTLAPTLRQLRPGVAAVTLPRADFERLVLAALAPQAGPDAGLDTAPPPTLQLDLRSVCALQERRSSVSILLCGTSGTGKSTLASLLAARLGITAVVSTDSVRHMMRSFATPEDAPVLWASTYQAGAALAPPPSADTPPDPRRAAVQGYLAQAEAVMARVDSLIAAAEARCQSLVVEGVHLSPAFAAALMRRRPSAVPFLVHISNEAKHLERFAVRAKAMSLRPEGNRYVRHLGAIRAIQAHLGAAAERAGVPKVDNTNVDRSVATIHATVLGCLRRRAAGEPLLDPDTQRCTPVLEEYLACKNATWSGSDMLELIRRRAAERSAGEASRGGSGSPRWLGASTSAASTSAAGGASPPAPLSEQGLRGGSTDSESDAVGGGGEEEEEEEEEEALSEGEETTDSEAGHDPGHGDGFYEATEGRDLGSVLETDEGRSEVGELPQ